MTIDQVNNQTDTQADKTTSIAIQNWLVSYLADLLELDPNEIDVTTPFERYGLDSAAAVGLAGDLEDWIGFELDITLLYDHPTIAGLSKHLAEIQPQ